MKNKLHIHNNTGIEITNLNKFLRIALNEKLGAHWPHTTWHVTIRARKKGQRLLGLGHYNCPHTILYVDTKARWSESEINQTILTIFHELDHNLGLHHREMGGCFVHQNPDKEAAVRVATKLGADFYIGPKIKPASVKVKKDRAVSKLEKAKRAAAKYEKQLRAAERLHKKWSREVRRLESYVAKRNSEPVDEGSLALAAGRST